MAHPVLGLPGFPAAALLLLVWSICASGQAMQCSSDSFAAATASRQKEALKFQQKVESGPFYNALLQQAGKPQSCKLKLEDADVDLTYTFSGNANLESEIDPSIEYSEQRIQLSGMTAKKALDLLKEEELDSYGHSGCGIKWNHSAKEPGERGEVEVVYRGDACNCQARVIYKGDSIVALVLTSTC